MYVCCPHENFRFFNVEVFMWPFIKLRLCSEVQCPFWIWGLYPTTSKTGRCPQKGYVDGHKLSLTIQHKKRKEVILSVYFHPIWRGIVIGAGTLWGTQRCFFFGGGGGQALFVIIGLPPPPPPKKKKKRRKKKKEEALFAQSVLAPLGIVVCPP